MKNLSIENSGSPQKDEYLIDNIVKAVRTLDFFSMKDSIKEAIEAGISSIDIIKKGILSGLEGSGEMGLILAAEALEEELNLVDEKKQQELRNSRNYSGKVVVGTIQGDIHNLGKNISVALMKSYGMDVIDLGVDIEPERFVENAKLPDVKVIGISYLLSSVEPAVKKAMSLLKKDGLSNKIKVILGGAAVSREIAEETNADAYTVDALMGVKIIDKWLRK